MTERRLRVGSVPYLNARPLVEGLADDPRIEFVEDVPSRLARGLESGALDAALVSSVEALRRPECAIVPGLCIASRGPVLSVKVFAHGEPKRARSVALDGASLTAAALTRIAYAKILGRQDVTFAHVEPGPNPFESRMEATLVIGDRALAIDAGALASWDLGAAWTDWTGMPFVWAVWLARDARTALDLGPILEAAHRAGTRRLAEHCDARPGIDRALAEHYLRDVMRYRLGDDELQGLRRFGSELDSHPRTGA